MSGGLDEHVQHDRTQRPVRRVSSTLEPPRRSLVKTHPVDGRRRPSALVPVLSQDLSITELRRSRPSLVAHRKVDTLTSHHGTEPDALDVQRQVPDKSQRRPPGGKQRSTASGGRHRLHLLDDVLPLLVEPTHQLALGLAIIVRHHVSSEPHVGGNCTRCPYDASRRPPPRAWSAQFPPRLALTASWSTKSFIW